MVCGYSTCCQTSWSDRDGLVSSRTQKDALVIYDVYSQDWSCVCGRVAVCFGVATWRALYLTWAASHLPETQGFLVMSDLRKSLLLSLPLLSMSYFEINWQNKTKPMYLMIPGDCCLWLNIWGDTSMKFMSQIVLFFASCPDHHSPLPHMTAFPLIWSSRPLHHKKHSGLTWSSYQFTFFVTTDLWNFLSITCYDGTYL